MSEKCVYMKMVMLLTIQAKNIPLTCWTDVSFRSHISSNGCVAAGSKSFIYCLMPDDVVKQHLHMHEWYRKRPSSRYGCANASITDILLSYFANKNDKNKIIVNILGNIYMNYVRIMTDRKILIYVNERMMFKHIWLNSK